MSDLGFNKIAGAVLATGLGIIGLNQLSAHVYATEPPEKPGYDVPVVEAETKGGKPDLPPDWGTVLPAADVAAGQALFAKCGGCHKPTDENLSTAPGLNGILGRKPASHPGAPFPGYSGPMTEFAAKTPAWDYQHVYEFIKKPAKYIPGTKMTFGGMNNVQDRINVVAYLHSLNSSLPIPAPAPAAPAPAAPTEGAPTGDAAKPLPAAGATAVPSEVKTLPGTKPASGH